MRFMRKQIGAECRESPWEAVSSEELDEAWSIYEDFDQFEY
jgi:hypothetical protein